MTALQSTAETQQQTIRRGPSHYSIRFRPIGLTERLVNNVTSNNRAALCTSRVHNQGIMPFSLRYALAVAPAWGDG